MPEYRIAQLPSGFWCLFYGGRFLNAALPSEEAAKTFLQEITSKNAENKRWRGMR